jgi:hypothetical protein
VQLVLGFTAAFWSPLLKKVMFSRQQKALGGCLFRAKVQFRSSTLATRQWRCLKRVSRWWPLMDVGIYCVRPPAISAVPAKNHFASRNLACYRWEAERSTVQKKPISWQRFPANAMVNGFSSCQIEY